MVRSRGVSQSQVQVPEVSPPAQVSEVSPAAAQIVSFLAVPAATFDTEDHPSTGQKTSFLSSPGHVVSLF